MEVGFSANISSFERSFNNASARGLVAPLHSEIQLKSSASVSQSCLLESKTKHQLMDLYNEQDDEREIMLLAMILLQLHGVKLPTPEEGENENENENDLLNKKKRQRTSPDQLAILETIFQTDKMPNQQTRVQLADQLGMSSRRVQIWFQNKRAKVKRSVSKHDGDSSSDTLNQSSGSISPPSSPSSPNVPLDDESPVLSPTLTRTAPQIALLKQQPLQLDPPVVSSLPVTNLTLPKMPSLASMTSSNLSSSLKSGSMQFSLAAPFVEKQPLMTATY